MYMSKELVLPLNQPNSLQKEEEVELNRSLK
jgi:hypothetical protein